MYGVYNAETLEKTSKTVNRLHSRQSMYEKLFAGQITKAYKYYSQMHGDHGIQLYAFNSMLYLRMIKRQIYRIVQQIYLTITQLWKSN